ncbi:hypothetical protein [Clostridium tertium]|uniref:hypothetical protein n=1 Tax=Clostridium tertium TaxID=1559 RepID=UPI001FD81121|nr:hypothetical protein [Clostridium tertium]MBP1869658.1 hypothetical protein [Clostridium tertium]
MNIFDAGGITTAIAVIATIIIGTGIFALINTIFEIWYLGFGAMVGEWLVCCVISAFIVNLVFRNNTRILFSLMVLNKSRSSNCSCNIYLSKI